MLMSHISMALGITQVIWAVWFVLERVSFHNSFIGGQVSHHIERCHVREQRDLVWLKKVYGL
jgi:hypothetical protein